MIRPSELIINPDGTVFHLHCAPGDVAHTIILVGDPSRCDMVAQRFDSIELTRENREMRTITGLLRGKRISVVSTGIGCDNIDIVVTELDALFNVDFATREPKTTHTPLTLVRIGTSGAVNPSIQIGEVAMSVSSIGLDGLAYFYGGSESVRNLALEDRFIDATRLPSELARPYAVDSSADLVERFSDMARRCVTISASGFYAPQGRVVRLPLATADYIERIEAAGVDNFEMEGAAISLLGQMLGHHTITLCAIIAQRVAGDSKPDYRKIVEKLVDDCLVRLIF